MQYGHFDAGKREYVITKPNTPANILKAENETVLEIYDSKRSHL